MAFVAKSLTVKKLLSPELLLLGALCVAAYTPALSLPLMEDDYPNIAQALDFRSLAAPLLNPVFRVRATSYWAMSALYRAFQLAPSAYHGLSLILHIANTWLLYFALLGWPRMQKAAIWAAGFFAVYEGHQEAVMWFSAINELLQFFFGGLAMLLWMQGRKWLAPSLACFALALVSKESAVIFLALFGLALVGRPRTSPTWALTFYAALAALAVASIIATRAYSFRFSDGSFSLRAPFWITWPRGLARLLWFWGWIAGGVLVLARSNAKQWRAASVTLAWMVVALLPYSFLTYSTQIPSRQTYLASAGLAALFGLAMAQLWASGGVPRKIAAALAIVALLQNTGYLWTRKRAQFLARAQPTEQLIRVARQTGGPIWIRCFPLAPITAEAALRLAAGMSASEVVWTQADAKEHQAKAVFCYSSPR